MVKGPTVLWVRLLAISWSGGHLRFKAMQCICFHNSWCWLCDSQRFTGTPGSWPQGLLNVKHLEAPMTKLEWREIAPPCEKKSHLRLSTTFHLSCSQIQFRSFMSAVISNLLDVCRQIQLHSIHVSCDFEFLFLDVWFGEFISFGWLAFTAFIFASNTWRSGAISWDPHYSTNVA